MVVDLPSSPFLDLDFYQASNSDLANLNNPQLLAHLESNGLDEDRIFSPWVDLEFYQNVHPDLANLSPRQLLEHLHTNGLPEERRFSPFFDLKSYRSNHSDLANLNSDELLGHLQAYGLPEGRDFSPVLDVNFYRSNHPDLAAAGLDNAELYRHFLLDGLEEGRAASRFFDVRYYLSNHPDLVAAGFDNERALEHFVVHGLREGRPGSGFVAAQGEAVGNDATPTAESQAPVANVLDAPGNDAATSPESTPSDRPEETPSNSNASPTEEIAFPEPDAPDPDSDSDFAPPNPPSSPPPGAIAERVPTASLTPTPTRIAASDLPPAFNSPSVSNPARVVPVPSDAVLQVPEGFTVNVFAEGLNRPRWLAMTPSGDVLVTETPDNEIRLLRDTDGDGATDSNTRFAGPENGLNLPFGMAFAGDSFFVGNTGEVLRFPYTGGQEQLTGTGETITDLPGEGYRQHWTRNVVVSPDGQQLYVSVGSESNVAVEELPRASVQVMNLDGSNRQTFASGLRNPVGLDFNPVTGQLYATVNERDGLGDDLVPDYLTGLSQDEFYGWPYAYLTPDNLDPRRSQNGESDRPDLVSRTQTPDVLFQAHSAALGLQFYDGNSFPDRYENGAFVAFRGSWNRSTPTGYKLVFVPFDGAGRPQGYYEDFLTGFLQNAASSTTWGRPTGLLVHSDGSLLFTEEENGRIYRVQYTG